MKQDIRFCTTADGVRIADATSGNCVYVAPDEAAVREHAKRGGFPANVVSRVRTIIDPTTAEAA